MSKLLNGMLCLLLSLAWSYPKTAQAQFEVHPDSSFYTFLDSFYQYNQEDSAEGGLYNRVRRDVITWGTRLAPSGNMSNATRAMTAYTSAYKNLGGVASATGIVLPAVYAPAVPWRELGPVTTPVDHKHTGMGQIHRIAFHPAYNSGSNRTLYAGSHFGGLYRSDNGGDNWYNYHTDRGLSLTSVGGIAVSNNYVFICTGNGDYGYADYGLSANYEPLSSLLNNYNPLHTQGVYYNISGTTTWQGMNGSSVVMVDGSTKANLLQVFENGGTMRNIIVHPTNDNILYLATSQGIFKTTDRGGLWQQVLVGPSSGVGTWTLDTEWRGLEFNPLDPNIIYASGKEVYRSEDGGSTWINLNIAPIAGDTIKRINVALSIADTSKLYAYSVSERTNETGIYSYENGSWTFLSQITSKSACYNAIAVPPSDANVIHAGAVEMKGIRNNPSGATIITAASKHDDMHALEYPPHSDTMLFIGNHGGVEIMNRYSGQATRKYTGLGVATIWSFDDWEGNDSVIVLALQDNGIFNTNDYSNTWEGSINRLDGYGVRIDDHTGTIYAKFNNYEGLYDINTKLVKKPEATPIETAAIIPPDNGLVGSPKARIGNTFPMINHPKNEIAYLGFSELYQRKVETYQYDPNNSFATYDTMILAKTVYSSPNSSSNIITVTTAPTCAELEGVIVGVAPNFTNHPAFTWGWKRDTLCRLITKQAFLDFVMPLKSDLKKHQSSNWDRRILDIGFSEDDSTNYTYLATLGDNTNNRRCDFYVNDANSMGCDTCFDIKTANIPIDQNSTTGDPNPITGIAVDPLNGRRVWISLSGYGSAYKVYYSNDAGDSWTSYDDANGSLAALNLPINGILYQRGTNDRLYIATDAGIYVREGQGNWLRYGEEFPNVRVTEIKINYCVGKLRAATFGRGMWEADVLPAEESIAFRSFRSVDQNETWTTDKNMSRDIRVKAGATLVLKNMTLNMPKNGLIVVEPGGQLTVDSSTITNLCGQVWQGIEVWGTSQNSQTFNNQGLLFLTHSTIEHAKEAVRLWKVGDYPNASGTTGGTGGVVLAGHTKFLNNWRSAEFMKYRSNTAYLSEFADCTFEVNDELRQDFLGHVSAWDVGRLRVKGCTFRDVRSQKNDDPYGILTLSASVQLTAWQTGGNFQRNTFEGLSRGVVLGSTPTSFSNVVDQTDFVDNNRGVIVRASGGLKIIRNTFAIGNHPSNNDSYGVSVLRQGDFIAQQNDFAPSTNSSFNGPSLGFWVDDLGSGFNEIKNNTFTNLALANLAHGNSGFDLSNQFGGLQYLCNGQTGNALDITVMQAYQATVGAAIGTDQGDFGQPAYNSFSYPLNGSFGIDWHFSNDASLLSQINYWIPPNPTQVQEPTDTINVRVLGATSVGALDFCDLKYTNLGFFKPLGNNGDVATLSDLKVQYYQYWSDYQQLLQDYSNDPTSTTLPSEIGGKGQQLTSKANEVIFYYRNDTTANNWDSISVWIQHKVGISAEYELVEHYWSGGRYVEAIDHLSIITANYTLTDVVLDNHQDYLALLNLLNIAYQDNRTEATLTKEEVIALNELVEQNYGFAAMKAANIVDFFYSDTYRYHPTLPEGAEEKSLQWPLTKIAKGNLAIYPNPTTDWADVQYKLPEDIEEGRLVVTSTAGQQIVILPIQQQQGVLTLNTSQWLAGTYFVILYTQDKAVEQTQLIIRK